MMHAELIKRTTLAGLLLLNTLVFELRRTSQEFFRGKNSGAKKNDPSGI